MTIAADISRTWSLNRLNERLGEVLELASDIGPTKFDFTGQN